MRFTTYKRKDGTTIDLKNDINNLVDVHSMIFNEKKDDVEKTCLIDIRIGLNYLLQYYYDKIPRSIKILEKKELAN